MIKIVTDFEPIRLMVQVEDPTGLELQAFLENESRNLARMLVRGERCIIVVDASCGRNMSWAQQEARALWVAQHRSLLEKTVMGVAVLAREGEGTQAREWFSSLAVPQFVDSDIEVVLNWAFDCADDFDQPLSPSLVFQHDAVFRTLSLGRAAA
ncbi:MAG: hypothetical protein KC457_01365 [Myxococcales bacterium]|nr:hypothetical protein [Myxococcales bacterium]